MMHDVRYCQELDDEAFDVVLVLRRRS